MNVTRRELGVLAFAAAPFTKAYGATKIDSKIDGVQIGAITYSFNRLASPDPEAIIRAYVEIGLGEAELMSNHCEALAGEPAMPNFPRPARRPGGGRPQLTPEQQEERKAAQEKLAVWRKSTSAATWKAVKQKFNDAGVDVQLLCYNMQDAMTDAGIEYGFAMAKALAVKAITTSTTLTMAKRIAPIADEHKLTVGYHGHDATNDPNRQPRLKAMTR